MTEHNSTAGSGRADLTPNQTLALAELLAAYKSDLVPFSEVCDHIETLTTGHRAAAWDEGLRKGWSVAMRKMSDEPHLTLSKEAVNPYVTSPGGQA